MSHTVTKSTQAEAEWVKIFPKQVTESYTSSVTFIKQLTTVAVSTITYLKNVFPEECYTIETLGGVSVRILKKNCKDELAQFVATSLTYAFEAFDKRYLHKLALCFYEGESHADNLMEYQLFKYSYTGDGVTMDVTSMKRDSARQTAQYTFDSVREQTLRMIRSCLVMVQSCQNQMPPMYDISLRLYYNEAAPLGYQPPGFLSTTEPTDHLEGTNGTLKLGSVYTPFHHIVAFTYIRNLLSSHEAEPSQNAPMMTPNEADDFDSVISEQKSEIENIAGRILCACGKDDNDGLPLLTCHYCGALQHVACFGLRSAVIARHCCTRCSDADAARAPTDQRIADLTIRKRQSMCILRRTLNWCSKLQTVSVRALMKKLRFSEVNAVKLIKMLQSNGVIEDTNNNLMSPRKIIPDKLNENIENYFYGEGDFVSRLLAESVSQNSTVRSDPVADVLGPMDKINLQTATTLGKIIKPPSQDSAKEDEILMQYKEAILSNQQPEDELPLSGNHNPVKDMQMIGKKGKRKADKSNLRTGVRTKRVKTTA